MTELTNISATRQSAKLLDYCQAQASDPFVPNPAVLASSGWDSLHVELHQQPKFEIAEHQHTMHVIACGMPDVAEDSGLVGDRWLDNKRETERRQLGDIAIIPAGISHRCNWNTAVQFGILAILVPRGYANEPTLLQQIGQDWVNPDKIELIPQFMSNQDPLIQSIFATLSAELATGGIGSNLLVDSLKTTLAIHLLRNYCKTFPRLLEGARMVVTGQNPDTLAQAQQELGFDRQIAVNFKGPYFLTQSLLPILANPTSIVLNTSINAHIGMPNSSVYSASKAAMISLAKTLSGELIDYLR